MKTLENSSNGTFGANIDTNLRIKKIEDKNTEISNLIMADPEKALTYRILKQNYDEMLVSLSDLKVSNEKLKDKFDNILITVIIAPMLAGLVSIFYLQFQNKNKKT